MMSLHRPVAATFLLVAIAIAGCEPGMPSVKPGPESPHAGTVFPVPDGLGYVEIVKEKATEKKAHSRILAYFLDSSRNPMASTPTAVSLKLPAAGATPFDLKPLGGSDPTKAGALATEPIPDRDDLSGDLSATIDGKPVTVPISIR